MQINSSNSLGKANRRGREIRVRIHVFLLKLDVSTSWAIHICPFPLPLSREVGDTVILQCTALLR